MSVNTGSIKTSLIKNNIMAKKETLTEKREKPGSSNAGKYPNVKSFCGPAGGAEEGTYPVNSLKRAKSAIKLAHNAPDPDGVKACVYSKFPELKSGSKMKRRKK